MAECRELPCTTVTLVRTGVRRRLGHASIETTQAYTLLADKVADTEIRAARRNRETRGG